MGSMQNLYQTLRTFFVTPHRNGGGPISSNASSLPCSYVPIHSLMMKYIGKAPKVREIRIFARVRSFCPFENTGEAYA